MHAKPSCPTPASAGIDSAAPRRRDWFRQAQPKCLKCAIIEKASRRLTPPTSRWRLEAASASRPSRRCVNPLILIPKE
ncbi:MAG: hypothetical protein ABIF04_07245 [Chloroflexota bacterium]